MKYYSAIKSNKVLIHTAAKIILKTGGEAQAVECVLCRCKALSSNHSPTKENYQNYTKNGGMNQFRMQYIYTWKCHNENRCLKQKCLFSKTEQKSKTVPVWGLVPVRAGRI
jgi:hypothetical protein